MSASYWLLSSIGQFRMALDISFGRPNDYKPFSTHYAAAMIKSMGRSVASGLYTLGASAQYASDRITHDVAPSISNALRRATKVVARRTFQGIEARMGAVVNPCLVDR